MCHIITVDASYAHINMQTQRVMLNWHWIWMLLLFLLLLLLPLGCQYVFWTFNHNLFVCLDRGETSWLRNMILMVVVLLLIFVEVQMCLSLFDCRFRHELLELKASLKFCIVYQSEATRIFSFIYSGRVHWLTKHSNKAFIPSDSNSSLPDIHITHNCFVFTWFWSICWINSSFRFNSV